MRRAILPCLATILLLLTACNSAPPPAEPPQEAAAQTTTATAPAPTVSLPTASPTETPAPPTPTATLTTAAAQPSPTPSPEPSPTPQIYIVEKFDTLLGIAVEFSTTIEALEAANGVSEQDFLQIGQELLIPAPGAPLIPEEAENATEVEPDVEAAGVTGSEQAEEPAPAASANAETAPVAEPAEGETGGSTAPAAAEESQPQPQTEAPPASQTDPVDTTQAAPPPVPASDDSTLPAVTQAANTNPLTGLPVADPALVRRRPLLVRIGNDVGARQSQVGLNSADMVYEEITEWWVTRFTAIYLAESPNVIAPIRSARLINVQLTPQYRGALAHSGGSDPVRWEISQAPITNLDEYFNAQPYFYRPNQGWQTRLALDAQAARNYMVANGLDATVAQHGFQFSPTLAQGEAAPNIYIPYPRATSFTQWSYDPASGKYLRWINGAPLTDAASGQVAASNVIVYFAQHQPTDIVEDSNGATAIRILMNGRGPAWFFRDGQLTKGFWQTDGSRTPYFGYEDGSPYPLKPGNTWVQVVPTYFTIGLNSPDEASSRP